MTCRAASPDERTASVAAAQTRDSLLWSTFLLGAAIAAALIIGQAASPIAVVIITTVVAGEQLWHRREHIPTHVPAALAPADRLETPASSWIRLLIVAAAFGLVVAGGALLGGGSAALLGWPAGLVLRDLVMVIRVARWQARHRRILAWIDDDTGVQPHVLPR